MLATTIVASVNQARLRITIVGINYAPEPTGNAPYTSSLAEGLAAAGHEVHVVTGVPHYPEWKIAEGYEQWTTHETINKVGVTRLRHHVPRRPNALQRLLMEFSFGARLLFARWNRPDVVLTVSPALFSSGVAILRARLGLRRPAIALWVQDIYGRGVAETGSGSSHLAGAMSYLESGIFRSAHGVVAIHDRFKQHMSTHLKVLPRNIAVIRNWTHLSQKEAVASTELRERLGWSADDIVLLHAGNMGKKQGLENAVETARLAQTKGSRVRVVLMGDGNQRSRLEELAAGVERIQFLDPLPDQEFQLALASADVLLVNELAGVKEMAVPSKLTSYFNSGIPVVAATDAGSVTASEIAASGGGLRVDAGDPQGLLEVVESLGMDPVAAKTLGRNGLRFRHETLSEAAALTKYDEFLTHLAVSRS
ncbi:glycosyltransferase [Arthrobacter sp. NPDC056727]|uniref:glycosyltransferase n=1 Tax=Arthrobacter sp. NPDC056727 TaxID=3345927 RepID=UPI00366E999B